MAKSATRVPGSTTASSGAARKATDKTATKTTGKTAERKATKQAGANRLDTPSDFSPDAILEISDALKAALADTFALYLKTKNFHWHMSGAHFRDYHLMLDEQADQIYASTDELAERARKIGGVTLRSIGQISRLASISDNDEDYVSPENMLRELMNDNKTLLRSLRAAHAAADSHDDVGTTSLLENYIDEAERRAWFLFEANRAPDRDGR